MSINRNIRYYKPNDPYYYEVDNLPLQDLLNNDVDLQAQVNALDSKISGLGSGGGTGGGGGTNLLSTRRGFDELRPYTDGSSKIYVRAGNFISTMGTPATRPNGLLEGTQFKNLNHSTGQGTEESDSGQIGRTAVVQFGSIIDPNTGATADQGISIEAYIGDGSELWFDTATTPPPAARLDLVYVQALPSMDQIELDGAGLDLDKTNQTRARLGVIKGAGLVNANNTREDRFSDPNSQLKGRTMAGQAVISDPPGTGPYNDLSYLINTTDWGCVPAPDDILHQRVFWKSGSDGLSIDFNNSSIADALGGPQGALAGLPICYVIVPLGPATPSLSEENIIDIRPFFRTSELAYSDRTAIRGANKFDEVSNKTYAAGLTNPFATEEWVIDKIPDIPEPPPPPSMTVQRIVLFEGLLDNNGALVDSTKDNRHTIVEQNTAGSNHNTVGNFQTFFLDDFTSVAGHWDLNTQNITHVILLSWAGMNSHNHGGRYECRKNSSYIKRLLNYFKAADAAGVDGLDANTSWCAVDTSTPANPSLDIRGSLFDSHQVFTGEFKSHVDIIGYVEEVPIT